MDPNIIYIKRDIEPVIKKHFNTGKVIVIYGPRQAGKTTLLNNIFNGEEFLYLSCDQERIREQLIPDRLALEKVIGNYNNVIFDEAQHLKDSGLMLKILVDNFPKRNFVASGSSSFDLANKLTEPLTGRHFKFLLFPLSLLEINSFIPSMDRDFQFKESLIYGSYPEVFKFKSGDEKIEHLSTLTDSYLYQDILAFNLVKDSKKVRELLTAIAFQLGSEVSYSELALTVGIDRKTVEYYLDLLEKSFVLFRLYGFSRNLRSEINRKVKIYFYDLGVRNALINNFNSLSLRNDGGGMFENFVISEIVKKTVNDPQKTNLYFWRTYEQKEMDLVAEKNGRIKAFEIKTKKPKKVKSFQAFQGLYPESKTEVITMDNLTSILENPVV